MDTIQNNNTVAASWSGPERFLNRELSWVEFNKRVIEEANNQAHPLFERLRFLSISASNLEEFYMVRVAGLKGQVRAGITERSQDGLTPHQQLKQIKSACAGMIESIQLTWRNLRTEMEEHDIRIFSREEIKKRQAKWLSAKFENDIMPVLTPIAVDPAHPFPFIPNKGLSIALHLRDTRSDQDVYALIQIPSMLERFIRLPGTKPSYMLIEKVIMMHIEKLFPAPMHVESYATFRVIRDSEMEIEEEAEDLVLTFETALKRRRRGRVIHLSVHHNIDEELKEFLIDQLDIMPQQVYPVNGLVGLVSVNELINDDNKDMLFEPFDARFPERIRDFNGDCFAAISQKDIIVHHPYESFDVVVQFIRQAAEDPNVVSIKQTLYRTSHDSPIVKALIKAAEAGKSVTALVELKARFDEEANIKWAQDMERAGVQVVYGFINLKTHAKVSLVVRRESGRLKSYAHFGTGNYHPDTAKIYTDLSYFTSNKALCKDTVALFNYMTGYAKPQSLEKLASAPINMREKFCDLIDIEICNAKEGKPASIWAKCNAILDPNIIDKLYEASQAGVQIDLVVRGICTLRPGISGLSENIRVKSLVGRFLEHARIYCFANGEDMPSRKARVFISSADLMDRNISRRIEAFVPIENSTVHRQVLDQIMLANLKDQKQSWQMQPDGTYIRQKIDEDMFCAHDYFMKNPSLSGRGKAVEDAPMPPRLSLKKTQKPKKKSKKNSSQKS